MKKLVAIHHSIADWDRDHNDFALYAGKYTSPPTSLRATLDYGPIFLCNYPPTLCLPQGRILCQTYCQRVALATFFFRNQTPPGDTPNFDNCYRILLDHAGPRVFEVVNRRVTWVHIFTTELPRTKWINIELTWWNYPVYNGFHPLAIQFRAYYDGSWHDYGRAERNIGRWHDSAVNRVGFRPYYFNNYFDDTEIHAPV